MLGSHIEPTAMDTDDRVTNCKGHCAHYRREEADLTCGHIEYCNMDAHAISNGYASGFCREFTKRPKDTP